MPVDHYENFPVASLLLPLRLRAPVAAIYRFARAADDLADEGNASSEERLASLQSYRDALFRVEQRHGATAADDPATSRLFADLGQAIEKHRLDFRPFHDLLSAFSQDVTTSRYADFDQLLGARRQR